MNVLKLWYPMMQEIKFQLKSLENEEIDKDDFIQAIEEIYWHYTDKIDEL
jgi:hypothetical protein